MIRNDQKTTGTEGQSSRGPVSKPASGAVGSCFRISEDAFGIAIGAEQPAPNETGEGQGVRRKAEQRRLGDGE